MYRDMCINAHVDVLVFMPVHMFIDVWADMYVDVCADVCAFGLWYPHV